MEQALRIFLFTLWQQVAPQEAHGSVFTLTQPTNHKFSIHIPAPDFLEALHDDTEYESFAAFVAELNEEHDLRLNLAFRNSASIAARDRFLAEGKIREESSVRGGRGSLSILPAFSAEFDIGDEGHAQDAEVLPKSWEEIEKHLHSRDVPSPTLLVRSGHGYHAHWVFKLPVYFFVDGKDVGNQAAILNQFRNFQSRFIDGSPFFIDSTAGAEREWRLVGTLNRKIPARPRPVELVWANDSLFDIDSLAPIKKRRSKKAAARSRALVVTANSGGSPLDRLRAYLATIGPDYKYYEAVQLLLQGESFAQGGRHTTMLKISGRIVWVACSHQLFDQGLTDEDIISMFLPAFKVWEETYPEDPTTVEKEVRKLEEMIETSKDGFEDAEEEVREEEQSFFNAINIHRQEDFGEDAPEAQEGSTPLIVRYKSEWYIFNLLLNRYEERWFQKDEVIHAAREVWEVVPGDANRIIQYQDEKARDKDYVPEKLAEQPLVRGVIARSLRLSVKHEASFFDPQNKCFYIAHCPPRADLEAIFHAEIDEFIGIFGGEKSALLRDWLAVALCLDEPCAGLYLEGAPGVGKSLFAQGVASLWGKPATPFESFLGGRRSKFSNLEAPLILLEEGVADTVGITSQIRRFITAVSHTVERKGKDPVYVDGCPRLIIAANNSEAITEPGIRHTHSDSHAIMERIAYVNANPSSLPERSRGEYVSLLD